VKPPNYTLGQLAGDVASDLDLCNLTIPVDDLRGLQHLCRKAAEGVKRPRFIEIGSWAGRTALTMLQAVPDATIYCVDTWRGTPSDDTGAWAKEDDVFAKFRKNVGAHLMASIIPLRGLSIQWAAEWPAWQADLVYIDADHFYEAVQADIRLWTPKVRPGGILAGHDFGVFPGVGKAVHESGSYALTGRHLWYREV
jgi:predicted O-methyltransferase YrrM